MYNGALVKLNNKIIFLNYKIDNTFFNLISINKCAIQIQVTTL